MRPRERDAILGLVASWGDRRAPIARLQQNRRRLSMRKQERFGAIAHSFPQTVVMTGRCEPARNAPDPDRKASNYDEAQRDLLNIGA